jgi:hypothetical protein
LLTLAAAAKRSTDGLPVRFDKDADLEIPRRTVCWRPDSGPLGLRRDLRPDERGTLEARAAALELALEPFKPAERSGLKAGVAAMFGGFRSMRQQGDDIDAVVTVTLAVLREFPAWAVRAACLKIARRETRCDPRFAPNDAEIADVVGGLVKPYKEALDGAQAVLAAEVSVDVRRVVAPSPPPSAGDGKHGARVKADLARRGADRSTQEPAQ